MANTERASGRAAYIRGLMDGMKLNQDADETKIFHAMIELLEDLAYSVEELEDECALLSEEMNELDQDLGEIEAEVYGEDCSCGHHHAHDDMPEFSVTCPSCKQEIVLTDDMLEQDSIHCPSCDELLEFDFDDDETEDS